MDRHGRHAAERVQSPDPTSPSCTGAPIRPNRTRCSTQYRAMPPVFEFPDQHLAGLLQGSLSSVGCSSQGPEVQVRGGALVGGARCARGASSNASITMSSYPYVLCPLATGPRHTIQLGDYSFSWDDKRVSTKVLLARGFLLLRPSGGTSRRAQ